MGRVKVAFLEFSSMFTRVQTEYILHIFGTNTLDLMHSRWWGHCSGRSSSKWQRSYQVCVIH